MLGTVSVLLLLAPQVLANGDLSPYDQQYMSAVVGGDGEIIIQPRGSELVQGSGSFGPGEAAWGVFNDSMYLEVGWAKLELHTNPAMEDETCATAAGKLEGKISANRIYQSAMNGGL
jgi:hypothetical protein